MAAHDWRTGDYGIDPEGRGNFSGQQEGLKGKEFCSIRYFDCVANPLVGSDTYKVMTFDAGVLIKSIKFLQTVAEGAADTVAVGDSAGGTTFDDVMTLNASAGVLTEVADVKYKYYTAADYLLLTPSAAIAAAKFYIIVEGIRIV